MRGNFLSPPDVALGRATAVCNFTPRYVADQRPTYPHMKTLVRSAALTGGLFLAIAGFAQDATPAPATTVAPASDKGAAPKVARDQWHWIDIGGMQKHLGISQEQIVQLKEVETKYGKQRRELDVNLTSDQRAAKIKEILVARDAEAETKLTAEQRTKWETMKKEAAARTAPATVK
jgi:hypothetical protein